MRTGESVTGSSAAVVASTIGMRFSFIEKVRFALILMRTCCGYRPAAICNPEAAWLISERSLVAGVPGKIKRTFTEEELQRQKKNAAVYTDDADEYANIIKIIG